MKQITDTESWDPNCASRHLGMWLAEPHWFAEAVASVKAGTWRSNYSFEVLRHGEIRLDEVVSTAGPLTRRDGGESVLYSIDGQGIAHIPMIGPMMKGDSKFGGTNTVRTRRALRAAVGDREVKGIMLHIDSPGGTVDGTQTLADDVRAADATKPVFAHADDLAASAAFWVASQARQFTAAETAEIGSIGTVAVVADTSGKAEMEGVKVHVISTGEFKGAFAPGVPIPDEHIEMLQERVDDLNGFFLKAVSKGRKMPMTAVRAAADGRVFIASTAQKMGLVDRVQSFDQSLSQLVRVTKGKPGTTHRRNAAARLALAERQG